MSPTALALLDALRPRLLDSLRWRQRLPVAGLLNEQEEAEQLRCLKEIAADLSQDVARQFMSDEFLTTWLRNKQSMHDEQSPPEK